MQHSQITLAWHRAISISCHGMASAVHDTIIIKMNLNESCRTSFGLLAIITCAMLGEL